jgi:hypothetical protein
VIIVQSAVVVRVDRHRLQRVVFVGARCGPYFGCVCPSRKEALWAEGKSSNNYLGFGWRRRSSRRRGMDGGW